MHFHNTFGNLAKLFIPCVIESVSIHSCLTVLHVLLVLGEPLDGDLENIALGMIQGIRSLHQQRVSVSLT